MSLAQARRQASRMRFARRAFLALAALSGGSVLVFAVLHSMSQGFIRTPVIQTQDTIELLNARFIGRDDSGQEYVIVAERAERGPAQDAPVQLTNPRFENAQKQRMEAPQGVYDSANQRLELTGGFTFLDGSYVFTGPSALVKTDLGLVSGTEGVQGKGPLGAVRADAYEFHSRDGRLFLRGDVRGVLRSRGSNQGSGGSETP